MVAQGPAMVVCLLGLIVLATQFTDAHASGCPNNLPSIVRWSQWSGRPTSANQTVDIALGDIILLDETPPVMEYLNVEGILVADPSRDDLELIAYFIYINGGTFWIGSEDCPFTGHIEITLMGFPSSGFNPIGYGSKVLAVYNYGQLEIHGVKRNPTWTQLNAMAFKNDHEIVLAANVDWKVGEQIVIATTDFEDFNAVNDPNYPPSQTEVRTIASRPSANTVGLDRPLNYTHYGKIWQAGNGDRIDMRAEVGLLTRNVVIRGDLDVDTSGSSNTSHWGGHIMAVATAQMRIAYAELINLGQSNEKARYPVHFHAAVDQDLSYVYGNSIHDSFQRCVSVHGTNNLRVKDNVAYNVNGHCYFIEDGNEEGNVFEHNLGIKINSHTLLVSDDQPAVFWITNPNNHFYTNAAVGGGVGYWYAMPQHPLGLDTSDYTDLLRFKPCGDFEGNRAHSTASGLLIDQGLTDVAGNTALSSYNPVNLTLSMQISGVSAATVAGWDDYTKMVYGTRVAANILDFTGFKCSSAAMWGRASYIHVYNARLADNIAAAVFPGSGNLFQASVVIGETDNVGDTTCKCNAWWGNQGSRSRPAKYWLNQPIVGYEGYDAGGGDIIMDVNFHNFVDEVLPSGSVRKAGALSALVGPNVLRPRNRFYRMNFDNVQNRVYYFESQPWDLNLTITNNAVKGVVTVDVDGSITSGLSGGGCGAQIVGVSPLARSSSCVQYPSWNAWICPSGGSSQALFSMADQSGYYSPYSQGANQTLVYEQTNAYITRVSDSATLFARSGINNQYAGNNDYYVAKYNYLTNLMQNQEYYITITEGQSLSNFQLSLNDQVVGEWSRYAIPFPAGTTFVVTTGYSNAPVSQVSSKGELSPTTFFWDSSANLLWLHLETTSDSFEFTFGVPLYNNWASMNVQASCSSGPICEFDPNSITKPRISGAVPPSLTHSKCESNGGIAGGRTTYNELSGYDLFTDSFQHNWTNNNPSLCNISTSMAADGSASLLCQFSQSWSFWSMSKTWETRLVSIDISKYTHLQLKIRSASGFGDAGFGVTLFNSSWGPEGPGQSLSNPFVTDDGYTISDARWSTVNVPLSALLNSHEFYVVGLSSWNARPVYAYVDSIRLVQLQAQKSSVSGFPKAPARPTIVGPGTSTPYTPFTNAQKSSAVQAVVNMFIVFAVLLLVIV